jgi:4-amino-4-deoxy-L-arabinose transferase-like glycosyltransferase
LRLLVVNQLLASGPARFYVQVEPARIAWALVSGYGYSSPWPNTLLRPTAQQPPLYPILLAGIFRIAGAYSLASLRLALVLNSIFSALSAVLIYQIGKEWMSRHVALLASWVWSCWLYEIVVSVRLWESSLSCLLLLTGLWLLRRLTLSERTGNWLAFGAVAGLAALANTTLLAVFGCFWIWLLLQSTRNRILILRWGASVAVCVALLVPWGVRNYLVFHQLMPVRDNFGLELWIGNHQGVTRLYEFADSFPLRNPADYNQLGETQFMQSKRQEAVRFIRGHPRFFARLCGQRILDFWIEPWPSFWWLISLAAWAGLLMLLWKKGSLAAPEAIIMVVFPMVYYITHTWSTYRHPIEPVILLCAAFAVVRFLEVLRFRTRRHNLQTIKKAESYAPGFS